MSLITILQGLLFTDATLVKSLTVVDGSGGTFFDISETRRFCERRVWGFTWRNACLQGYCVKSINGNVDKLRPCVNSTGMLQAPIASKSSQNDAGVERQVCSFVARPHPGKRRFAIATILDIDAKSGFYVIGFQRLPDYNKLCSKDIDCGSLNHCERDTKIAVGKKNLKSSLVQTIGMYPRKSICSLSKISSMSQIQI